MILSVSSISAGDLDDDSLSGLSVVGDSNIDIISDGDVNGISNERSSAESVLEDADNSEIIFQNDFEELSYRINNTPEGDLLVLDKNYKFTNDTGDASTKGIIVSKSITIDGNGHTIDASKLSRVFNITADNVVLKNINFINGNALGRYDNIDAGGGALYWYGANGKVLNCNFTNNTGYGIEDDPFDQEEEIVTEDGMVYHIIRVRPMGAKTNEGGAIVWRGNNGTVSDCIFKNNDVGYPNSGGAICWRGNNGQIINSTFFNNSAWCGGAVTWVGDNGKILSSKFFENGMFNGDVYWFGEDGLIKNCILLKSDDGRAVVVVYDGSLNANYNFWGDTLSNPNGTRKIDNLSNWYILNRNSTNPVLIKGNDVLVAFDDFLLVVKNGKVYDIESEYIGKINLNPNAKIVSKNLIKYYKSSKQFMVKVYGPYGKLAIGKYVIFKINKKSYKVKTNKNGIACLKINQKPGKYNVLVKYGKAQVKNKITVKSVMISKNLVKKSNKVRFFRVKALDSKGRPYAKQLVKVSFRGKTYKIKTKADGIARFVPSNKLKAGKYKIKVSYKGLTNANTITVKK
ncbi:MAG: hypothetical protein Q4P11_05090 [Methanobrevibacter sp.]|nr:hypothetical protein [Methanobrevibacter sp.]